MLFEFLFAELCITSCPCVLVVLSYMSVQKLISSYMCREMKRCCQSENRFRLRVKEFRAHICIKLTHKHSLANWGYKDQNRLWHAPTECNNRMIFWNINVLTVFYIAILDSKEKRKQLLKVFILNAVNTSRKHVRHLKVKVRRLADD